MALIEFLSEHFRGLANLSVWAYIAVTMLWMHITMMAITLYFHRDQAHRSINLHPVLRHFFRFWLWLNTGAPTREWIAVHRKHHAFCEREGDPHSPAIFGLKTVVLEGAELYKAEAANADTLDHYGKGAPDDWIERNVYARFTYSGIGMLVVADLIVFGVPGIIMLAFQLATMPVLAAGIINGVCHAKGYRTFETNDASTNLWPIGLFVAGEELHNNHHAFPTSARFSMRPRELDMGWLHIKVLEKLGLAKVRRVATQPVLDAAEPETTAPGAAEAPAPDLGALRAVMMNRMHVLRHYMHNVTLPVLQRELEHVGENTSSVVQRVRQWLSRHPELLDSHSRERLAELAAEHPAFATALEYRNELKSLWEGAYTSNEKLLADFRAWCASAEASGIQALQEFVTYLKSFRSMPEPAAV